MAITLPKDAFAVTSADLQAQADAAREKLNTMMIELGQASDAYNQALEDYDAAVAGMDETQQKIDDNNARIADLQRRLAQRAHDMYTSDRTTFLDIVLGSATYDEFIKNWDALNSMNQQDANLVIETKSLRVENEIQKETYQHHADEAEVALTEADEAREHAESLVVQYQAEVNALDAEVAELIAQEQAAAAAAAAAAADMVDETDMPAAGEEQPAEAPEEGDGGSDASVDEGSESDGGSSAEEDTSSGSSGSSGASSSGGSSSSSGSGSGSSSSSSSSSSSRSSSSSSSSSGSSSGSSGSSGSSSSSGSNVTTPSYSGGSGGANNYGSAILAVAQSQLGVDYVFGASEPGVGFDCSGLTSYCWSVGAGIWIGRTSASQYANAQWVGLPSQAQTGDVLWTSGHVGIAANRGGSSYIHAPVPGDVVSYSSTASWNPWVAALRWY
ncbi:cell wall-associated hydrolase, invasion-associated protein [Slackia heliotrinireducens DSM 20476]|uniref:Cell wall-associated hydrolase, invasion-associated protein n=1 Tax=Slackia heliotrinireducens (strain ATCC 29202 / DSM 20476 / NCTC 11029 / RHS 1) TaxID=471855 RepID=C7N7T3_SLAHD|nr:cell wall-associated hydrolase, invasion-associated protein [Slackia heliotrinireducens DSM 20476]